MENKSITEIIDSVKDDICNNYCKWPNIPTPEGKDDDWLYTSDDSPCMHCPLDRL